MTSNTSFQPRLACEVFILSLSFILGNLIMMWLGVCFLGSKFFGTLWASWTSWKSISFARLGNFSFIIFSDKFSISCPSSSPLAPLWFRCWNVSRCPGGSYASIFFELFLYSVLVECFFLHCAPNWVLVSFLSLLVPCRIFFISHNVTSIAPWIFFMLLK